MYAHKTGRKISKIYSFSFTSLIIRCKPSSNGEKHLLYLGNQSLPLHIDQAHFSHVAMSLYLLLELWLEIVGGTDMAS
jgi:hypothetical protein